MNTKILNYRIIVEKEQQDKKRVYVAYAPSLGISDFGSTINQAVSNIEKAIKAYIDTLVELHQSVPQSDTDDYFVTSRKIEVNVFTSHAF